MNQDEQLLIASLCLQAANLTDVVSIQWDDTGGCEGTGCVCIGDFMWIEPWTVEHKSIVGTTKAPGWRVYTLRTQNNYPHAPDDVWDEDVLLTPSYDTAVIEAVTQVLRFRMQNRQATSTELEVFDKELP